MVTKWGRYISGQCFEWSWNAVCMNDYFSRVSGCRCQKKHIKSHKFWAKHQHSLDLIALGYPIAAEAPTSSFRSSHVDIYIMAICVYKPYKMYAEVANNFESPGAFPKPVRIPTIINAKWAITINVSCISAPCFILNYIVRSKKNTWLFILMLVVQINLILKMNYFNLRSGNELD